MAVISKERLKQLRQKKIEIRKQQVAKAKAQQEKRQILLNKRKQLILQNQEKSKLRSITQSAKMTKSTKLNKQQQLISNMFNNISNHNDQGYGSYNYSTGCKSCGG